MFVYTQKYSVRDISISTTESTKHYNIIIQPLSNYKPAVISDKTCSKHVCVTFSVGIYVFSITQRRKQKKSLVYTYHTQRSYVNKTLIHACTKTVYLIMSQRCSTTHSDCFDPLLLESLEVVLVW